MSSKGQLHFTFSTKQPSASCELALLHPLPVPHPRSAGHSGPDATKAIFCHLIHPRPKPLQAQHQKERESSQAHQADSVRECCSLSESLLWPLADSHRGFPGVFELVGRPPCLAEDIDVPLVTNPFQKRSYSDGAANLETIHYQGMQQPSSGSSLSLSLPFLGEGVACGEPATPFLSFLWGETQAGQDRQGLMASSGAPAIRCPLRNVLAKAPGRKARQRDACGPETGGSISLGLQMTVTALYTIALIPLLRAEEKDPVPSTVPGTQ